MNSHQRRKARRSQVFDIFDLVVTIKGAQISPEVWIDGQDVDIDRLVDTSPTVEG